MPAAPAPPSLPYPSRESAGQALAAALLARGAPDPAGAVVLGLVRGGVPVALPIAQALHAPLGLAMVRKVGLPYHPEIALAAVANGTDPVLEINAALARQTGLSRAEIAALAEPELAEIARRRALWLAGRPGPDLAGKTVILADDGLATGATMRAAIAAARRAGPARVIVALPVAAPAALPEITARADTVICLATPADFGAVGQYYKAFTQLADADVSACLKAAEAPAPHPTPGPG